MTSLENALFFTVVVAIVAVFVYENWKRELQRAKTKCVCGHRLFYFFKFGGHVRAMDYDSNTYIAGAAHTPGQCRECKCRMFIAR